VGLTTPGAPNEGEKGDRKVGRAMATEWFLKGVGTEEPWREKNGTGTLRKKPTRIVA